MAFRAAGRASVPAPCPVTPSDDPLVATADRPGSGRARRDPGRNYDRRSLTGGRHDRPRRCPALSLSLALRFEPAQVARQTAAQRRTRRGRKSAGNRCHLPARRGDAARLAKAGHRHLVAEQEGRRRHRRLHLEHHDAAADGERARRRGDGDRHDLADLAANQAERALGRAQAERAELAVLVVDELVEHEFAPAVRR